MKTSKFLKLAAGAALTASAMAAQAVVFGLGLNDIEVIDRENNYRPADSCGSRLVGGVTVPECLPTDVGGVYGSAAAGAPEGYLLVNPALPDNVRSGDIFVGVFASRSIIANGVTVWNEDNVAGGGIDTFTGYFAQEVREVALNIDGTVDRLLLSNITAGDPFGILANGEVARVFVDQGAGTPWQFDGISQTVLGAIQSATDGTLWASLGTGTFVGGTAVDDDGYNETEVNIGVPGNSQDFNGTFYNAWNILLKGAAYNLGPLTGINDPNEVVKSGALIGDPTSTAFNNAAGICVPVPGVFACNDIVGNGQLLPNQNVGPWVFASEDPLQLYQTPEPGSLALLGVALFGLAGAARRRRS
ncbi:MAG: PEP-CTERM sorting domain-containing protein [Rubrivivax sp.]|nr:PEP-CTERM sorting domain-containing protein [Rubrivivax sp.]